MAETEAKERANDPQLLLDERYDFSSSMSASVPQQLAEDQKQQATATTTPSGSPTCWPCANCHSLISEDRCPFCHGIQVKIKNEEASRNLSEAWIERVSPSISRTGDRYSPPSRLLEGGKLTALKDMMLDNDLFELDDDDDNEAELLEQTSESPPRHHDCDDDSMFGYRPNNPVACLLATAESPFLPKFFDRRTAEMDDDVIIPLRDDLKKTSKDRVVVEEDSSTPVPGKKQRILFAAM